MVGFFLFFFFKTKTKTLELPHAKLPLGWGRLCVNPVAARNTLLSGHRQPLAGSARGSTSSDEAELVGPISAWWAVILEQKCVPESSISLASLFAYLLLFFLFLSSSSSHKLPLYFEQTVYIPFKESKQCLKPPKKRKLPHRNNYIHKEKEGVRREVCVGRGSWGHGQCPLPDTPSGLPPPDTIP